MEPLDEIPHATLAEGLSEAFRSDQTPVFEKMVTSLYRQSNPAQKAGLINQILAALGPVRAGRVLPVGWIRSLPGILRGGRVTPEQARQIPAEEIEVLARHAAGLDPSIVDKVADFYARHRAVVTAIGDGALALLISRAVETRR